MIEIILAALDDYVPRSMPIRDFEDAIAAYIGHSQLTRQEIIAKLIAVRNEEIDRRIVEFCKTGK